MHHFRNALELRSSLGYLQRCEEVTFYKLPEADAEAIRSWLIKWKTDLPMTNEEQATMMAEIREQGEWLINEGKETPSFLLKYVREATAFQKIPDGEERILWGVANGLGICEALCLSDESEIAAQRKRATRRAGLIPTYYVLGEKGSIGLLNKYHGDV